MSVPGLNLLANALKLIQPQTVRWFAALGQTTNAAGLVVADFAPGVDVPRSSVQAVPLTRYAVMGLDFKRRYVMLFLTADAIGLERDRAPDEFEVDGRRYSAVTDVPWFKRDGWVEILAVDIGAASDA